MNNRSHGHPWREHTVPSHCLSRAFYAFAYTDPALLVVGIVRLRRSHQLLCAAWRCLIRWPRPRCSRSSIDMWRLVLPLAGLHRERDTSRSKPVSTRQSLSPRTPVQSSAGLWTAGPVHEEGPGQRDSGLQVPCPARESGINWWALAGPAMSSGFAPGGL